MSARRDDSATFIEYVLCCFVSAHIYGVERYADMLRIC